MQEQYTCLDEIVRAQDWRLFPSMVNRLGVQDMDYTAFHIGYYGMYIEEFISMYEGSLEMVIYGLAVGGHICLFATYYDLLKERYDEEIEYCVQEGLVDDIDYLVNKGFINESKLLAIARGSEDPSVYHYLMGISSQ